MAKMIDGGTCQIIAEELQGVLPAGWERVVFHCGMSAGSYNMFFHVYVHGEYIQCYDLPQRYKVTEKEIDDVFEKIYSRCGGSGYKDVLWFTLTVHRDGKFSAEQEHEDLLPNEWEKRYLK